MAEIVSNVKNPSFGDMIGIIEILNETIRQNSQ